MLISKDNLIVNLSMVMKLQIFTKKTKKNPKFDSNHTCLAVINLDFALKKNNNYYPQVVLKKCKYIEKKVVRHICDRFFLCF